MMDTKNVPFGWATAYGNSDVGTGLEQPLTGWFKCGEYSNARATIEFRGATHADLEVRVSLQFADYPDQDTMTIKPLGGYVSADGITYPSQWELIENESKANQICRVIAEGKLKDATPGGLQCARISGRVELNTC